MSICKYCGTDLEIEAEVFSKDKLFTGHSCRGTVTSPEHITAVLKQLFRKGQLTTPEQEKLIKGEG